MNKDLVRLTREIPSNENIRYTLSKKLYENQLYSHNLNVIKIDNNICLLKCFDVKTDKIIFVEVPQNVTWDQTKNFERVERIKYETLGLGFNRSRKYDSIIGYITCEQDKIIFNDLIENEIIYTNQTSKSGSLCLHPVINMDSISKDKKIIYKETSEAFQAANIVKRRLILDKVKLIEKTIDSNQKNYDKLLKLLSKVA